MRKPSGRQAGSPPQRWRQSGTTGLREGHGSPGGGPRPSGGKADLGCHQRLSHRSLHTSQCVNTQRQEQTFHLVPTAKWEAAGGKS